ncbi:MAG TPA: hypothetical protein VJV03_18025 [Pyrinomonadaceae bacterium]|nr:hypothetical protein [Pyrinomonadaceae bacterium]
MTESSTKVWFPEPLSVDDSFARRDESWFDWLSRCTSLKGRESRRFLNHNINALPPDWQPKLVEHMRTREWHSVFFEMAVARTLQILGASIAVEVPVTNTNRQPDFTSAFPDVTITVEATVPELNRIVGKQMSANEDLVKVIESLTPDDWSVEVWRLPKLGPNDSKRAFKQTIRKIFSELPPATLCSDSLRIENDSSFDGELAITLRPGRTGKRAAPVRGLAAGPDDAEQRIAAAVANKKRQVRKATTPVILAISTSPFGDLEDYDRALYGLTFEEFDINGKHVRAGFRSVGAFGTVRSQPPTIAGVLAYRDVGFTRVVDPVLYLHPRFVGTLPDALHNLEVRSLDSDGISVKPAQIKNLLVEMEFVRLN